MIGKCTRCGAISSVRPCFASERTEVARHRVLCQICFDVLDSKGWPDPETVDVEFTEEVDVRFDFDD